MRKSVKILIILLTLILVIIFILLIINREKPMVQDKMINNFNIIYFDENTSLEELILNSEKIEIATGCNSIFAIIHSYKYQESKVKYYNTYFISNQEIVREFLTIINPSFLPEFNQEDMLVYELNKDNKRFEINNEEEISNIINISNFCPPEKQIKHATITANFSTPAGYIDENGNLQKY